MSGREGGRPIRCVPPSGWRGSFFSPFLPTEGRAPSVAGPSIRAAPRVSSGYVLTLCALGASIDLMQTAVGYVRTSAKAPGEEMEAQTRAMHAWCARHRAVLVDR